MSIVEECNSGVGNSPQMSTVKECNSDLQNNPKMSIDEEYNSDVGISQPLDKSVIWAEIVRKGQNSLGFFCDAAIWSWMIQAS